MPDIPESQSLVAPVRPARIRLALSRDDAVVLWTILSEHKGNAAAWGILCDLYVALFPDKDPPQEIR